MGRWVKKWWWLCLVIGATILVIGWKERRCQIQAEKCRADYAAQESRLFGFSVDGNAAEEDAIDAACEPNSYFCRLFSAANLPTVLLVFVGFGGIWAAIRTLRAIERQAGIMERQISIPYRAYLTAEEPEMSVSGQVKVPIKNYGQIAARIVTVGVEIIVQKLPNGNEMYRRDIEKSVDEPLIPGKEAYWALFVNFPEEALAEDVDVVVGCTVTYETGFKDETGKQAIDILRFCPVYSTKRKAWTKAWTGVGTDFRENPPK